MKDVKRRVEREWDILKAHIIEREVEDIEQNIKILKSGVMRGKIHSFLCLWYPFKGSVDSHIKNLEARLYDKKTRIIELRRPDFGLWSDEIEARLEI